MKALAPACLSLAALAMGAIVALAGEVPKDWYPIASATRILSGVTGAYGKQIIITSATTAELKGGPVSFRRLQSEPCTFQAVDRDRKLLLQMKFDHLYNRYWQFEDYFGRGLQIRGDESAICWWSITGSPRKCFSEWKIYNNVDETSRALEYIANGVCQPKSLEPF